MIALTRLNGTEVFLNADLIATVESFHDTVVTLVDGKTYVVHERAEEVVDAIIRYRARVLALANQWAMSEYDEYESSGRDRPDGESAQVYVLRRPEAGE